jgi:uncharacterized protein YfaS (alpha-2-macroglobulin family)
MTMVELGLPPGFELLSEAFAAMKEAGTIERYTVTSGRVTLSLRELESAKPLTFRYEMRAKYPVRVQTPPSIVYQYYEPAVRAATEPVTLISL